MQHAKTVVGVLDYISTNYSPTDEMHTTLSKRILAIDQQNLARMARVSAQWAEFREKRRMEWNDDNDALLEAFSKY